jgi:GTP cyclohydrolase II
LFPREGAWSSREFKRQSEGDFSEEVNFVTLVRLDTVVPVKILNGTYESHFASFVNLCEPGEHVAILFGDWKKQTSPLVRIHSECLTGDVFGSARCDCGPQLNESIKLMAKESGIILYLRQEGRGIGLYNKLRSYVLQDQGMDTFEANRALKFPDDMRNFKVAAEMLEALDVRSIELLSNNPEKQKQLIAGGIKVTAMRSTGVFQTKSNTSYLKTKALQKGHSILVKED